MTKTVEAGEMRLLIKCLACKHQDPPGFDPQDPSKKLSVGFVRLKVQVFGG